MSDLISREDALKTLSALVDAAIEGRLTDRTEGLRDAKDIIRALPAVQPKVKPLVWETSTHYSTDDDGGPLEGVRMALSAWKSDGYLIIQQRNKNGLFLLRGKSDGIGFATTTLDAAKAAAQADYEARALPAVQPHVNETPKIEHDERVMLTPATKGAAHD